GVLFLSGICGCGGSSEPRNPVISRLSASLPVACGCSRPIGSNRRGTESAGEGHRHFANFVRHVCPRPGAVDAARGPRSHARRSAQSRLARMTVTRRLAAILAADIASYSRLMGQDEAGTAQALREHRSVADPLVAEHGGRIVKTTGDGV